MFTRLNRLGDRLLSAFVPNATAAAGCQPAGGAGSCWLQCCTSGTRVRKELCCPGAACYTIGEC
jgi:hypothetical protein